MEQFKKRTLNSDDFTKGDNGIEVGKLLTLIDKSEYLEEIKSYFDIPNLKDKFISIKGSSTLFTILKSMDSRYKKIDLRSNLKDIQFNYEKEFGLVFKNLGESEYFNGTLMEEITAYPIHSGQRDFFQSLYNIDKYADSLLKNGYRDILNQNLESLKLKEEHVKRYRLIHDTKEDEYYLRAIISEDRYYNYDNNIAFVI